MIEFPEWGEDAECAKPINRDAIPSFFANKASQQVEAKKLCDMCPVKNDCAKWALENKEIWGIWGGLTPKQIRRTLSVNWDGQEMRHRRFPLCPGCKAKTTSLITKTVERPSKGRWATMKIVECVECNFSWQSRTSANAVDAFHAIRIKKLPKNSKKD